VKLGLSSALQFHGIMSRVKVVRGSELGVGELTQGIVRKKAFESQNAVVSQSQVAPGVVSGWHHHGTRQLYRFIVSGRLQLEYFLRTKEIADLNAGDFFHIPARLIHRDLNPNKDLELVVVNILVGSGPSVINVDTPPGETE
jgi:mannose-6-phosphate isomerase-like protein (cupin superfamily)